MRRGFLNRLEPGGADDALANMAARSSKFRYVLSSTLIRSAEGGLDPS